jgi:hypothetical protein
MNFFRSNERGHPAHRLQKTWMESALREIKKVVSQEAGNLLDVDVGQGVPNWLSSSNWPCATAAAKNRE